MKSFLVALQTPTGASRKPGVFFLVLLVLMALFWAGRSDAQEAAAGKAGKAVKAGKTGKGQKPPKVEPPAEPPADAQPPADPGAEGAPPADGAPPSDPGAGDEPPAEGSSPVDPGAEGTPPADPAADPASAPPDGDAPPVEGEEPPPPPPSEEQVQQIFDQAKGLVDGGKADAARTLLEENPQAVATSSDLKELLVQAMVQSGKPIGLAGRNLAEPLVAANSKHPWANFALGLYFTEDKKKPDYTKALKYLGAAKALKRPPAGVGMVYWKVFAKSNLYALIGGLAALIVLLVTVVKKRKKKQAELTVLSIEDLPPADGLNPESEKATTPAGVPPAPGDAAKGGKAPPTGKVATPPLPPKPAPEVKPAPAAKPSPEVKPAPKAPEPSPKAVEVPPSKPSEESPRARQVIVDGKLVDTARKSPVAEEPVVEIDLMAAAAADSSPPTPALAGGAAPVPREMADRWEYLRQKAQSQAIPPAAGPVGGHPGAGSFPATAFPLPPAPTVPPVPVSAAMNQAPASPQTPWGRGAASVPVPPAPSAFSENPGPFPPVREEGGIVLDLSPERRQEDLVGKLKMFAIEDGELRLLLQQRNPAHLPALFEYVMTRPESVRLAFVARELGHYHDPAVTDLLAQLLYHEDVRVVLAAIQGMQLNADPSGILHICPFLISPDGIVSEAARNALMSFGPAKILDLFVRELPRNSDDRIREAGVFVLSRMKGGAVTNLLVQMLADRSIEVRKKVVMGMTFQKDPQFLPVLREFMKAAPEEEKKLARKAVVYLQGLLPRP